MISLSYFYVKKSTKSQQGGLTPSSFRTSGGVHELVARAMRGECVRQRINRKSVVLRSPQSHTTTRANKVHEKAEQIRARIVCTPAESARRELAHMRSMCVGVAETGGEHRSPAVIYERYVIYISSATPHNSNRRKKQSGDCSPLCFWKEKLLFSTSKNDSLILGIRVEFLECYTDLNLCAILLINCCRGYAAA